MGGCPRSSTTRSTSCAGGASRSTRPGPPTREDVLNRARVLLDSAVLEAEERLLVVRVTISRASARRTPSSSGSPSETLQQLRAVAAEVADAGRAVDRVGRGRDAAGSGSGGHARPARRGRCADRRAGAAARDRRWPEGVRRRINSGGRTARCRPTIPPLQIAAGRIPERLVEQARAMVLAELARR